MSDTSQFNCLPSPTSAPHPPLFSHSRLFPAYRPRQQEQQRRPQHVQLQLVSGRQHGHLGRQVPHGLHSAEHKVQPHKPALRVQDYLRHRCTRLKMPGGLYPKVCVCTHDGVLLEGFLPLECEMLPLTKLLCVGSLSLAPLIDKAAITATSPSPHPPVRRAGLATGPASARIRAPSMRRRGWPHGLARCLPTARTLVTTGAVISTSVCEYWAALVPAA